MVRWAICYGWGKGDGVRLVRFVSFDSFVWFMEMNNQTSSCTESWTRSYHNIQVTNRINSTSAGAGGFGNWNFRSFTWFVWYGTLRTVHSGRRLNQVHHEEGHTPVEPSAISEPTVPREPSVPNEPSDPSSEIVIFKARAPCPLTPPCPRYRTKR